MIPGACWEHGSPESLEFIKVFHSFLTGLPEGSLVPAASAQGPARNLSSETSEKPCWISTILDIRVLSTPPESLKSIKVFHWFLQTRGARPGAGVGRAAARYPRDPGKMSSGWSQGLPKGLIFTYFYKGIWPGMPSKAP